MSDRLWKITATYGPDDDPMMWEEATTDEVLAHVRRGVESGTIKGAEGWFCNSALAPRCTKESHADVVAMFGGHSGCQRALVIPVSDGGSET